MNELRCLHTQISHWGTPQARCDTCGASFDWRGGCNEALNFALMHLERQREELDNAIVAIKDLMKVRAAVAQSVERDASNVDVAGSTPANCSSPNRGDES